MRTKTLPFLSISSSSQEPRAGIRFAMKTCFSRSLGSIRYAPGERTSCVTTTRSVPLITKVPRSVIHGKSPMNTDCSRISPVSRLMKATVTVSGRAKVMSFSRHCSSDATGSSKVNSPNCTARLPV